ncbi:MAG: gliding motility lipoprotein GldH [Bacteroidota bacterium]|nr:gliding motility lipoprotein GldH [Bacteroidota bacterium]MDP4274007.1 gliding motility lipoprotein GldH [Bacteroidota bacterium]
MVNFLKKILILAFLSIAFISCDSGQVYEQNIQIPNSSWSRFYKAKFKVSISDTLTSNNLYINIRNSGKYSFNNLFIFIKTIAPSGESIKDTVEIKLADNHGKWLGKGLGDIKFLRVPYKKNVRFPRPGTYTFEFVQGMRTDNLKDITDIGLRVEKMK